jgi:ABC-type dipeptide/oligopeptide/nickel transport system permease component
LAFSLFERRVTIQAMRRLMSNYGLKRLAGVFLFLVVTACWVLGLAAAEQDWITWDEFVLLIVTILSAVSVVLTGYLGRIMDAVWLGWIPGAVIMAVGFAIPAPGDEVGSALIFVGGLVLIAWPVYFLPLIALGVWLRQRRVASAQAG